MGAPARVFGNMTPQMIMFYERLKRIARIHRKGGGFEAPGTLGQSYYTRMARKNARPVIRPVLYAIGVIVFSKSALLVVHGPDGYAARVSELQSGTTVERAGSFLMGIDPVTQALATTMVQLLARV